MRAMNKHSVHGLISAGSIPDCYDIYRYLNLVRYLIFDTFVVNVISSTYIIQGLLETIALCPFTIFQKIVLL